MQKQEIKVLHIISSMGIGGAERQLLELIEENKSHGICQLVPNNIWGKKFLENKHRFFHLGMRRGFPDPRSIINLKKKPTTIEEYKSSPLKKAEKRKRTSTEDIFFLI